MRTQKLIILLLIVLFTVLQCSLLDRIKLFGVKPDLLLILIVFFSLYFGQFYGLTVGAICGFFAELTSGITGGITLLLYSGLGLILGYTVNKWIYSPCAINRINANDHPILSQILITFIFTATVYLCLFIFFQIQGLNLSGLRTLVFIIFPSAGYTAIVAPLIFSFLKIIFNID